MNTRPIPSLILLSFIMCPVVLSQSPVQNAIRTLDSLSFAACDEWRMSPDLSTYRPNGDPTSASFDDSGWKVLRLNERVYPDSCWLRKIVVLPKAILGTPVSGPVRFLLSVDDYGYLWVNGRTLGHFPWDGDFEISPNARGGQSFVIAIKAVNTGGPLRLIRAEVRLAAAEKLRQTVEDLKLSLQTGAKLLSFDTYQTNSAVRTDPGTDNSRVPRDERIRLNELLQSSVSELDYDALTNGPEPKFMASVDRWRKAIAPVAAFVKGFSLQFVANAHIDAAWLWRERETIEVCKNTFNSVNNILNAHPDVTYTQSSAAFYKWMEDLYPDTFAMIKKRVQEGRWEVSGGMWIEPDCNLPSGDSWMRHLLYAKRYFKRELGVDVALGWNPDSFGYNANMPMLYQKAGIDAFITQKIGWNDTNVFPHRLFWWESQDGSRILALFPFDYVNEVKDPFRLVDWARQFEANTGFRKMLVLFGVGNHGGGPSIEMINRIRRLTTVDIYPTIDFGPATAYIQWLKEQGLDKIPVWTDELYLEYHRGTYTTQAAMKKFNRQNEALLTSAETFSSFAAQQGYEYPAASLAAAWETVLFNQFHDILPGSSIHEVYVDAAIEQQRAQEKGAWEYDQSAQFLTGHVGTSTLPEGTPVVVFNSLSWPRTDVATVDIPKGDMARYSVFDAEGHEIPSQTRVSGFMEQEILFTAKDVPAFGYASYVLRPLDPHKNTSDLKTSGSSIENEFYSVRLDEKTGWVASIVEKRSGKELLEGPGNALQVLEDKPRAWDAWNIGLTGVEYPTLFKGFEVVESGPVRVTLRAHHTFLRPGVKKEYPTEDFPSSFFDQDISLSSGIDRVDFTTHADWWEEKTMLKVAFPVSIHADVATYEIPFGAITRSTGNTTPIEKAQFEVPSHRWASLADGDLGVALLNRSKYGYDIKKNVMRLSLLRSPIWPDPMADRGTHDIEYALSVSDGKDQTIETVRRGSGYNTPLKAVIATRHKGTLPLRLSFVTVSDPAFIVTSIKKAEDSSDWIITGYNPTADALETTLTFPSTVRAAYYANALEEKGKDVATKGENVTVSVGKRGMVIFGVRLQDRTTRR